MGFSLKKSLAGGLISNLFGGDSEDSSIARPTYYTDPNYTETQDALKGLGLGLLKGEVPDYYSSIGQTGGKEFEDMLGLTTRDIQKSAAESLAKTGRARGGALPAMTAQSVADTALKARYQDYNRALTGKEDLLKLGIGVSEGVRGAGQTQGGNVNAFNWKDYAAQVDERNYQDAKQAAEDAALGQMIGTIASVGLGVATGGMSLGLEGAMAGGLDAFTGGGTDMFGTLMKNPKQVASGVAPLGAIGDDYRLGDYTNSWLKLSGRN